MNYRQLLNPWVIVQVLLFSAILLMPDGTSFSVSDELTFSLRLVGFIGWAILFKSIYDLRKSLAIEPIPSERSSLQVHGIYRFVRHPMYVAVWFIFGGISINRQSWLTLSLYVLLIVFFIAKSRYEENQLILKFPEYKNYMKRTGAFLPSFLHNR